MILPLLKKDWLLLWPMVLLVTAIQAALQWAVLDAGLFGDSAVALELLRPLTLAWFLGMAALTVAVVQQDPVPGVDLDWLIRPLRRRDVLLSKGLFVVVTLCLPMFALDLAQAAMMGFPLAAAAPALLFKEMFLFAFFMLPVLALAATTRNMAELLLLGAALIVVYAVGAGLSALVLRDNRCPTCDTGLSWLEHFGQHTGILLGSLVILALQYSRRRTGIARAIALLGTAALVFAQVPWTTALVIQRHFLATSRTQNTVILEAASEAPLGSNALTGDEGGSTDAPSSRQATRALLRGEVDEAIDAMRRGVQRRPSMLAVPLRVSGVGSAQMLLVDRVDVQLVDEAGRTLYRGVNPDQSAAALRPSTATPSDDRGSAAGGGRQFVVQQPIQVPPTVAAAAVRKPVQLKLGYTMTLMTVVAEHRLTAVDGAFRSPEIGLCASRVEEDHVAIRCKQAGHAPFCYGATLFAPDGSYNPEVTKCWPDYRPYGAVLSALSFFGVDLPVHDRYGLAHYPVDESRLLGAYALIRVYGEVDHFQRVVTFGDAGRWGKHSN